MVAVYGGAGVADQIADLKRGADIIVCTPGRMIEVLTLNKGHLISLNRVTYVVLDEVRGPGRGVGDRGVSVVHGSAVRCPEGFFVGCD